MHARGAGVASVFVMSGPPAAVQVLQKALSARNLTATPLSHPDMAQYAASPGMADGYICNLEQHWYTIRPVNGAWWNFNSLQPAPTPVGDTYLDAYLTTLRDKNWTIYVIEGKLPDCLVTSAECRNGLGRVWTAEQVLPVLVFARELDLLQ